MLADKSSPEKPSERVGGVSAAGDFFFDCIAVVAACVGLQQLPAAAAALHVL